MKRKNLLVYAALTHPLRANTQSLIDCFRRYSDDHWFYLNLAHKKAPHYLRNVDFDLIIFQTTFVQRLSRSEAFYNLMVRRAAAIGAIDAPKVALAQDEFWNASKIERFVRDFGVQVLFSVSPQAAWPKLYPKLNQQNVKIHQVLTGYLEDSLIERMSVLGGTDAPRVLDVVYRSAGRPSPAWGRDGFLKQRLADAVRAAASRHGLNVDISTDARDAIAGDAWYEFLAGSRYTIGVESGTSLMDRDGTITERVEHYLKAVPDASFEEVEENCFLGLDGNAKLNMIGPRHLEACATRTCQILVEGEYNGILKADVHYIPLRRDFSNLDEVLGSLNNESRRKEIVQRAFDDIVKSGKISYRNFVAEVLDVSFRSVDRRPVSALSPREKAIQRRLNRLERIEWTFARQFSQTVRRFRDLLKARFARSA